MSGKKQKKIICCVCHHEVNFEERFPHKVKKCGHIICDICFNKTGYQHNCEREFKM